VFAVEVLMQAIVITLSVSKEERGRAGLAGFVTALDKVRRRIWKTHRDPHHVPDFIALRGDPSDKLPGAPNVGAQGAADLLHRYGTLEALLKAGRFAAQAKELRMCRAIATMDRQAPLPRLPDQTPSWDRAAALSRSWGLNQLADRLVGVEIQPDRLSIKRCKNGLVSLANEISQKAAA